jgi:uncharacterized membrane protein
MLCYVALSRTDVSEERIASGIRVRRVGAIGTTLSATSNRSMLRRNTMRSPIVVTLTVQAIRFSETSVLTRATRRNNPEDTILHSHRRENLKSYIMKVTFFLKSLNLVFGLHLG